MDDNYKKFLLALNYIDQNFVMHDYFSNLKLNNGIIKRMNLVGRQVAKEISDQIYNILNSSLYFYDPIDPIDECIVEIIFLYTDLENAKLQKEKMSIYMKIKIYTKLLNYLKKC